MSNTEKGILEKAAASIDPVVRNAALRRMEIEQEMAKLDLFLSFYAGEQVPKKVKVDTEIKVDKPEVKVKKTRNSKGPKVADAACQLLIEIGHPLQLLDLFNVLQERFSEVTPPKMESLRPRLHEQRDKIAMIKGKGYWPAGLPLPSSSLDALHPSNPDDPVEQTVNE